MEEFHGSTTSARLWAHDVPRGRAHEGPARCGLARQLWREALLVTGLRRIGHEELRRLSRATASRRAVHLLGVVALLGLMASRWRSWVLPVGLVVLIADHVRFCLAGNREQGRSDVPAPPVLVSYRVWQLDLRNASGQRRWRFVAALGGAVLVFLPLRSTPWFVLTMPASWAFDYLLTCRAIARLPPPPSRRAPSRRDPHPGRA